MIQKPDTIVYIVDDDARVCEALEELLAASGLTSVAFRSIGDYLSYGRDDKPACLVLDVGLPDVTGLEFQDQIDDTHPPIVFITGHADVPSSVRAIKRGAVDFLIKPFSDTELLSSIEAALERDISARTERADHEMRLALYASLTPREREAFPLVVSGLLNKQAAAELGISEVTMQVHRGKIMQKMEAASLADLVRTAEKLHISINHSRRRGAS
jgi:FixJ family two-component response regulator